MGMNEEIKLLLEDLWNSGLSKQGKLKLEQNIKVLQKQLQAYKQKEDKLRGLIAEPCAVVLGHDILEIIKEDL